MPSREKNELFPGTAKSSAGTKGEGMPSHFTKGARKKQAQVRSGLAETRSVARHHSRNPLSFSGKERRFGSGGAGSYRGVLVMGFTSLRGKRVSSGSIAAAAGRQPSKRGAKFVLKRGLNAKDSLSTNKAEMR